MTEILPTPESSRIVPVVFWFDVDGVITDPKEKRIIYPELTDQLVRNIESGIPVIFNTGRSIKWMEHPVLDVLESRVTNPFLLAHNIMAVGEKGGTWATYDEHGTLHHARDETIMVPSELTERMRKEIKNLSRSMFFDEDKETMISLEMRDGYDLQEYHRDQQELDEKIDVILKNYPHLVRESSIIATDIQNAHVGKHFGAERILAWMQQMGIKTDLIITAGDSPSDIAMTEHAHSAGFQTQFVYVGDDAKLPHKNWPFQVIRKPHSFTRGTLEYLRESKAS